MLTGLYFSYVATCYIMRLPLFCFLLSSRPEDNVQKIYGKDSHKEKYTGLYTTWYKGFLSWFPEGQADVMLN